ncbi:MAG: head-tail adaptor protein [Bacilli bacterium]|nr:head-tail adaptor protein [Bacilli bacterium]
MKKEKLKHPVYNDGVLEVGQITPKYDKTNKKIGEDFIKEEILMFSELSKRDEDYNLANSLGYVLDVKLKVPRRKISSKNKIKIKDTIYDIYKIDNDNFNTYLYLQVVEK